MIGKVVEQDSIFHLDLDPVKVPDPIIPNRYCIYVPPIYIAELKIGKALKCKQIIK
jgi:hypothetical protein